ncbi:MAG: fatty acid desaturase [Chloroflexi bacterium]|nr:fatty acid desaturase [Chloroflexota bacterium]MBI3763145.1 fatty acid desaturase [Chloroflexota bacterium]
MSAYPSWQEIVAKYQNPDLRRSLWQIVNSFAPFLILWYLMYRSLEYSYWLTLVLALPTAGLLMRVFIILHDCGHGSFFKSQRASDMVGTVCGVLTFTPYLQWRHEHAIHHASSGDLARRGTGDVVTLTVKEYLALSWWEKLKYRVYRHPLVMFGIGPTIIFLFTHRFPSRVAGKRERLNLHLTNLGLLALFLVLGWAIGFKALLLVHGPIFLLSSTVGVWMFYVQHQFEDTYWKEHQAWDYVMAALQGSSFYRLPKLLQWFTGNIGLHHIHHLSPKIPNYNLQKAFDENPLLQQVTIVTLWESLRTIPLRLWDENQGRMVGFGHLKTLQSN